MMRLFKPAWMSENQEKALKAVEKTKDKTKLTEAAEYAPLEAVRTKAKDILMDLRYKEIRSLVLSVRGGSPWAMKTLLDDNKNWGGVIFQCFSDDILFNDTYGNIKSLISQIAISNNKERTGANVPTVCPSYTNGMCSFGNQICSLNPQWYPVCSFQKSEFFDNEAGETYLKGY